MLIRIVIKKERKYSLISPFWFVTRVDAFIWARDFSTQDWIITGDNGKDYSDDKCYYICRWLNHSFMPFTEKQQEYYQQVKKRYNETTISKSTSKGGNP